MELNELVRDAFYWNTDDESVQQLLAVVPDITNELAVAIYETDVCFYYSTETKPQHLQPVTAEQMAAIGRDIDGNLLPPTPKVGEWWVLRNHFALIRGVDVHRGYATVHYVEAHYEQWQHFSTFARKATDEEAAAAQALYDLTRALRAQEGEE